MRHRGASEREVLHLEDKERNDAYVPEVPDSPVDSPAIFAEHVVAAFMSQTTSNPIAEKMTPDNIDRMLDSKVKIAMFALILKIAVVAIVMIGVVVIILLLRSFDIAVMSDIIKTLLTAAVSFAGGYGFGKSKKDD